MSSQAFRQSSLVKAALSVGFYLWAVAGLSAWAGGITSAAYTVLFSSLYFALAWVLYKVKLSQTIDSDRIVWHVITGGLLSAAIAVIPQFQVPGAPAFMVVFPLGIALFVFVRKLKYSGPGFVLGFAGNAAITHYLGWEVFPPVTAASTFGVILLTGVFCTINTVAIIVQVQRRSLVLLDRLKALEQGLEEEGQALQAARLELDGANAKARLHQAALNTKLLEEASLTDEQRMRLSEEQAMANAVHQDLREPLRSVISFTQILRREVGTSAQARNVSDYFDYVEDGGLRMARMLDDLMAYAKADGQERASLVDLNQVLNDVTRNLADLVDRSAAQLLFGQLPHVFGYPTQLTQLFQNLISNALKFRDTARPVRVWVSASRTLETPERYALTIRDNGIGIPPNRLDHVFGLFNRVHEQQHFEGSGVGLALCRRIAIAHNGELSVTSSEGVGTTFTFLLPSTTRVQQSPLVAQQPAAV